MAGNKGPLDDLALETLMNLLVRGIVTVNEIRARMGLTPIEGGDDAYIQGPDAIYLVSDLNTKL